MHNPCTTGPMGQRTAFGWMGYSIRVEGWRFTVWLGWDGQRQQAQWQDEAGRELYAYATGADGDRSFDTEPRNLAHEPAHATTAGTLYRQLRVAWGSWAPRTG